MMGKAQSKLERFADASMKSSQAPNKNSATACNLNTEYLLQPPDETSIKRSWIYLGSLIDSHVEVFYNNTIQLSHQHESIKKRLKASNIVQESGDIQEIAELLETPGYRKLGLRVCIARAILSSIDFYGSPEETSLDPLVVGLLRRFNRLRPNLNPEQENALSHWRMITAFFLQPDSEHLQENSLPCLKLLTGFLAVFRPESASGVDDRNWADSLRTIAQQGIVVGEKLFCHPSTWSFDWYSGLDDYHPPTRLRETKTSQEPQTSSRIVLFPALVEPLGGCGSLKKRQSNLVQAAETAPNLVFLGGKITPLAASFSSCSPSAAASIAETPFLASTSTSEQGAEGGSSERSRRTLSTISGGASPGAPDVSSSAGIVRRTSTIGSVTQSRNSTGRGAEVRKRKESIRGH